MSETSTSAMHQRISAEELQLMISDCDELLSNISKNIEVLTQPGVDDMDALADIRRHIHNLKGLSAVSGNEGLSIVVNRMEDYLLGCKSLSRRKINDMYIFIDCTRVLLARCEPASKTEFSRIVLNLPERHIDEFFILDEASGRAIEVLTGAPHIAPKRTFEDETHSCCGVGLKALVLGGDTEISPVVIQALNSIGIKDILWEVDGFRGFETIVENVPDLLIIDEHIKGVDVLELINKIRHDSDISRRETHIVMCSENSDSDRVMAALDAGVTEFVVKPFPAEVLEDRMIKMLERPLPFVYETSYVGPDRRVKRKISCRDAMLCADLKNDQP